MIFQERVMSRRQAEFDRRRVEREEQINQLIQARKQEREALRKKIFYVRSEEERQRKLREEEEACKREGIIFDKFYISEDIKNLLHFHFQTLETDIFFEGLKNNIFENSFVWLSSFIELFTIYSFFS